MKAVIDIGSNSLKLLIGKFDEIGRFVHRKSLLRITRLGENLGQTRSFSLRSRNETLQVLREIKEVLKQEGILPQEVFVVATEASRVATNANSFFREIKKELDFDVRVLTSEGEAFYSSLGCILDGGVHNDRSIIMDLGGASTELVRIGSKQIDDFSFLSIPVGAVRSKELYEEGKLEEFLKEIILKSGQDLKMYNTDLLVCIGGIMTSFGNIFLGEKHRFDENEVSGVTIAARELFELFSRLSKLSILELSENYPFLGKRVPYIMSGLCIALFLLNKIGAKKIMISCYGLRHGLLYEGKLKDEFLIR